MLSFWFKLTHPEDSGKLSCVLYRFLHRLYNFGDDYKSPYLSFVETTLNNLGLSGLWLSQFDVQFSINWFKAKIKQSLIDQYIQQWYTDVDSKEGCCNYRMFKTVFQHERYIDKLPQHLMYPLLHFRTLNHRLPVQTGRTNNIDRGRRLCSKCDMNDVGDEFHYIMLCPYFTESRQKFIGKKYYMPANSMKFHNLFTSDNKRKLSNLSHFTNIIMKEF